MSRPPDFEGKLDCVVRKATIEVGLEPGCEV